MSKPSLVATLAVLLMASPSTAQEFYGDWVYGVVTDPITDEVTESAFTIVTEGFDQHGLGVVCDPLRPLLLTWTWLTTDQLKLVWLERGDSVKVIARFDKKRPFETTWFKFGGRGLSTNRNVPKFVEGAKAGQQVVLRVTVNNETVTKIYSLDGFTQAYSRLSCRDKWP